MKKLPVREPDFLLPKSADLTKFAVVACDQFTSNIDYWKNLDEYVGDSVSALRLILPECYLSEPNLDARIADIHNAGKRYLQDGVFAEYNGYVRTVRTDSQGKVREGIIMALDLDEYDFDPSKKATVRATEGTVPERIPPRAKVREEMEVELPHVMVLYNDKQNIVSKAISESERNVIYDFKLNMGGGSLYGEIIRDKTKLEKALYEIYTTDMFMAVGDGNHSLATAKKVYNDRKARGEDVSKCRYALIEAVNVYDNGLVFEPIHRAVFGADERFIDELKQATSGFNDCIDVYYRNDKYTVPFPSSAIEGVKFIEEFLKKYDKFTVDYIHGTDELIRLANSGAVSIKLKPMDKSQLFDYVAKFGVLPKKTFSMGEAQDKRYYLEARKIK